MGNSIKVGMADLQICVVPDSLTTLGLGSCVGIALYDRVKKVSGLAHIMLPDSTQITRDKNPAKFADTGIDLLIEKMVGLGADSKRLQAKIAGGAQMFSFQSSTNDLMRIGDRNVEAVKKKLKELGIPILAEDTGANYGRTIVFFSETGELLVKSVGKPEKIY